MVESDDNYQVTIVKYGTRTSRKSDVYLNFHLYDEPDAPIEMDYFFWIIKNAVRTIVVDTGFSRRGGDERGRTLLADVAELFDFFGVDPATSPQVLLTHAHYDHIGNLQHFPMSQLWMAQKEFDFWTSRNAQRTMFHHSVEDDELKYLRETFDQGRLTLFDDRLDVAPGIEAIVVGGHTPGQCIVTVQTNEGLVLLASDAIHYYEEYDRDMLFTSVSNLVDMYEGFDLIHEMQRWGKITHLVSGHDPDTLNRFTPATGRFAELASTIGTIEGEF
jgi:glyoxylase-like metal-dependent hydrolase (beta-lactamase superfamily II)